MRKLVAKKDKHMQDGVLFLVEGKEYEVRLESKDSLLVHTEITDKHIFSTDKTDTTYFGKYFVTEEDVVKETVVEVVEAIEEVIAIKEQRPQNQSKKHK